MQGVSFSRNATGFRHLLHRLRDPAEFGVAVSGAVLAADFLAPQATPAEIEQFQSPEWALDFHEAGVKARICGPLAPGWVSLGLMRAQTDSCFHGVEVRPGVLICNTPGEAIDGRIAPGFRSASLNLPSALWEHCRRLAGVESRSLRGVRAYQLSPAVYAWIESRLQDTRESLRAAVTPAAAHRAASEAREFVIDVGTMAWELASEPERPRDSRHNRARLARRAEEWMRARLSEPWQVSDLCLALRVSRREIEYAFRTNFDTSPREFALALRLNAVRRALQNPAGEECSVSRVALDYGITHFSRFSANYRALFGENPSETRRR